MNDRLPVLEQAGLIVRHQSTDRDYFVPHGAEQKLRAEIAARERRERQRQQGKERTR